MKKTLAILGVSLAGTVIISHIASLAVKTSKPLASFTPEEWAYYHQNWPASRSAI